MTEMQDREPRRPESAVTSPKPSSAQPPAPADEEGEFEDIDLYTAEIKCKCGKPLAANAWFCPRCGRVFLINMLFALVVLATGFALMNWVVQYLFSLARIRHQ